MTVRRRGGAVVGWTAATFVTSLVVVSFLPRLPRDELVRTTAWSLAALASFAGFGGVVARVSRLQASIALRAVLGMGVLCALGGLLALVSLASRPFLLAFVVAGVMLFSRECVMRGEELARAAVAAWRWARARPAQAMLIAALAAVTGIHYLGGASDTSSNPYDDDVAYYPFAKELLQRGTLVEPFSFRRMSTLGGQALHQALLLVRVGILHLNVFDRSMCLLLVVGLVASHRIGRRAVPAFARWLSVVFVLALPNVSINSASYYSGLALFLALYQLADALPDEPAADVRVAIHRALPLALVAATLCTLRQNYQATVASFILLVYGAAALNRRRASLRERLREPVVALALIVTLVMPWLALLDRSNGTFLFPLIRGTLRPGVSFVAHDASFGKSVRFFLQCCTSIDPITTAPLFAFVGLALRGRAARWIAAQWIAAIVSTAMLCWAFTLSDPENLVRYLFAYVGASAVLTWHAAAARLRGSFVEEALPAALVLFALVFPVAMATERTRKMLDDRLRDTSEMLRRTVPPQAEPPVARAYHALQNAVPPGAPILVMVDKPYLLDFGRNPIREIDMPAASSPAPGIPCFRGAEPVADYLMAHRVRYVLFVDPEKSTYEYRRDIWVDHVFDAKEIWRVYAPYFVDVMDNLVDLARTRRRLAEAADMILVDLDAK